MKRKVNVSLGALIFGVIMALGIGGFIWICVWTSEQDSKRHEFLAQCIEFHTVDRCRTLYYYGRTDLGLRPEQ